MGTGKFNTGGNPAMDEHSIQEGVEILLVISCYRNQDKLWPDGPLGLYADFTFYLYMFCSRNSPPAMEYHLVLSSLLHKL